jgi:hypothetical protein
VTYSGTLDEGTLFAGQNNNNTVLYTTNPQTALPTWTTSLKSPSLAASTAVVVRIAADFGTTERVFAGTTGVESAFNISNDAGVSFNGEALIDNGAANTVVAVQDVKASADGASVFVATDDGVHLALWKSDSAISPTSWSRVWVAAGTAGMVRLNPDWADTEAVYFLDLVLGGSSNIWYSSDGGATFAVRTAPAIGAGVAIGDLAVEDATTTYLGDGNGSVWKSTSRGWTWSVTPALGNAGAVQSLHIAEPGTVVLGGTGACSYSTDGGSSFTRIAVGLAAGVLYQVVADEDFATNDTIYAGGNNAAAGNIMRFTIGESSAWVSLGNPAAPVAAVAQPIVGMGHINGTLYGVTALGGCDRNLSSTAEPGIVALVWTP